MSRRVGVRQPVLSPAKRVEHGLNELEERKVRRRVHRVPYRYRDLDLDWESDRVDDGDRGSNAIYYRGVHVANLCVEPGGWCRSDREKAPKKIQEMLGYTWLNFEDRRLVHELFNAEDLTHLDEAALTTIRMSPFADNRKQMVVVDRFYQVSLRFPPRQDDAWLYEKLDVFRKISRKHIEVGRLNDTFELSMPEDIGSADSADTISVLSAHAYLRKRVLAIGKILSTQVQLEKVAMRGDLETALRCCAYYFLSCAKTEGSSSARVVCQRQLQLLDMLGERHEDLRDLIKSIICQLNFYLAAFAENITIEDVAFKINSTDSALFALIYPPTADMHTISLERFVEIVLYKRLVKSAGAPEREAKVLEVVRSLFVLLLRNGDIVMLVTCVCAILSKLSNAPELIAYNQIIVARITTRRQRGDFPLVGEHLIEKYSYVTQDTVNLYASKAFPWLALLLKHIPKISAAVLAPSLLIESVRGEAEEMYNNLISIFGIMTDAYEVVKPLDWLETDEMTRVLARASVNPVSSHLIKFRSSANSLRLINDAPAGARQLKFLLSARISMKLKHFAVDWSDEASIIKYFYEALYVEVDAETACALLEPERGCLRQFSSALIADLADAQKEAKALDLWTVLVVLKMLKVPAKRLAIIPLWPKLVDECCRCFGMVVEHCDFLCSWFEWCRFINRSMSFYYRYKQSFDDPVAYQRLLSIFQQLISFVPVDSRFAAILNGSINARFSAVEITPLANFWCCILLNQAPTFWVDLDVALADFAARTHNEYALERFAYFTPYFEAAITQH